MLIKAVALLKAHLEQQELSVIVEHGEQRDFVELKWKKDGDQHYVYSTDIVYLKGKLAWFQSSIQDAYRLCVLDEGRYWEWEPEMHNPAFGCWCLELRWIKKHLLLVYQEKNDLYVAAVHQGNVRWHNFHGEWYKLTNSRFAYQSYHLHTRDLVQVLKVPGLVALELIELRAAKKLGLEPVSFS